MEQHVYEGLMNKIELSQNKKKDILTNCLKMAEMKKQRRANISVRWASLAACLTVLVVVVTLGIGSLSIKQQDMPLTIRVYAEDTNGEKIYTVLELNQKVKLFAKVSSYDDEFAGFAFDMTLLPEMYVSIAVVDKDGTALTNQEACGEDYSKIRWALTEGDDVSEIYTFADESVPVGYKDRTDIPKKRGKSIIWMPNEEGNNYVRLGCYNAEFERVVTFYLEMSEEDGDYFAEIIRIN